MSPVTVYNQQAEAVGTRTLASDVFGVPVKANIVHEVVVAQAANRRQVLAHTKTRAEVRGGGRKPWRQKGTGRARAGSSRSPIWIGGGVTFGPRRNRNFTRKINNRVKQLALRMALSDRVTQGVLGLIDNLQAPDGKTKVMAAALKNLQAVISGKNVARYNLLVVTATKDELVKRATRNVAGITVRHVANLNATDVVAHANVLLTTGSADVLERRYGKVKPEAVKKAATVRVKKAPAVVAAKTAAK